MEHCCNCAYWNGTFVGYWESCNLEGFPIKARIRCQHPKHFNQPKVNYRKACKYFKQKEIKSIIIHGKY